jgi:hypothetical protein
MRDLRGSLRLAPIIQLPILQPKEALAAVDYLEAIHDSFELGRLHVD